MAEARREPILRLMPGPGDINANGHIFGGWVLSQMDKAGGIIARLHSGGPVATIAIDRMEFIAPIHLRDLISVYAEIENVGHLAIIATVPDLGSCGRVNQLCPDPQPTS